MKRNRPAAAFCVLAAATVLGACASTNPDRPESTRAETASGYNVQLGVAYLRQNNLTLAKEKLERALVQNPRDPNVHSAMAMLQERLNDSTAADRSYRTALRLAPKNPDILNNYAVYLCRTGRTDEGVKRLNEVARNRLYRSPEVAYTNAGVCLRGAKRLDEAAASFERALKARPGSAEAAYQIGDLDLQRGRTAEARTRLEQYLNVYPPTADLLWLAARLAREQGDRLAEERFGRRLQRDFPNSEQARLWATLPRTKS
jgi:type IV pilus assembly protein PilF